MDLPVVNAVWIGHTMGPLHAACLRSFVISGHRVVLHAYGEVADAPEGVSQADANRLLPEHRLIRHKNGSYALSSDLMRYELLRQELGLYVDCDVFCLKPIADADHIFGLEDDYHFNTAVLKLPAGSPVMDDLCAIGEGWLPPWMTAPASGPLPLSELPWGSIGPAAFTHYARKRDLAALAEPHDVFYPVTTGRTRAFFDPGLTFEDIFTSRTRYVHLYHQTMNAMRPPGPVPPSSPLGRMLAMVGGA